MLKTLKSLLSRARRFFEPRDLEMYSYYAKDGECYMVELMEPLPRVVLATDRFVYMTRESFSFEDVGYEMYDKDVAMRASYYARRPWLWLLRAWTQAGRAFWRAASYTRGKLWHDTPESEGRKLKWRDVRPGPVPLGWFGRVKPVSREVWIRFPRWVYNLRLLVPVNYKTEREPGSVALYLQFGCPGWRKWPKLHLGKLAHVEVVPWRH